MATVDGTYEALTTDHFASSDRFAGRLGVYESFGSGDVAAPVVTPTTPTATPTAANAQLSFTVTDETELRGVCVVASYDGSNTRELVWDSTHGFNGFYLGSANHQTATYDVSGKLIGRAFTILRDGGWPANITITVFAFDDGGNAAGGF